MSTTAISSLIASQPLATNPAPTTAKGLLQAYFKARRPEVQALNDALKSGDLAAAQTDYNNLVALGQKDLGKDNPFLLANRAIDFNAIGGALQRGDLDGARQAFAALQATYIKIDPPGTSPVSPDTVVSLSKSGA